MASNLAEHLRELGDEFERHGLALVVAIRLARVNEALAAPRQAPVGGADQPFERRLAARVAAEAHGDGLRAGIEPRDAGPAAQMLEARQREQLAHRFRRGAEAILDLLAEGI